MQVVQGLQASEEYRARIVEQTYLKFLHRASDPAGRAFWIAFLGTGGNQRFMEALFIASDEYFTMRSGGTNDGFLTALYGDVLGRSVDQQGATVFGTALRQGVSRLTVALAVLGSNEANNRVVPELYLRFLDRLPDPQGLTFWVTALNVGATLEQVIQGLAGSTEYFNKL